MKRIFAAILLAATPAWASGPNVLSNTDHIVADVMAAISILGGSTTIDQTCPSGNTSGVSCLVPGGPTFVAPPSAFIADATNGSATFYSAGSATPVNHTPYGVINQSSTGYDLERYEQLNYNALTTNAILFEMAFCGGPGPGDPYPPVAMSTILPNTAGPLMSNACGYGSGIEFSMTAGYKGFATGTPSGTTEAMSGVFQVLAANHPTWTWSDIKAALRQTASNWVTGYTAYNATGPGYGYGNIDYDAATALASTASIYLQAPGMAIVNATYYATITLYPFATTRRAKEVVYAGGFWPAASSGNELTAAQITSAGGTKIIDTAGRTGAQTYTYVPGMTGSVTFTALTLDASGNGSRVETFSQSVQSFITAASCLDN